MRRGDAGCCASAALGKPNGPQQTDKATKAKARQTSDHRFASSVRNGIDRRMVR